MQNRLPPHRKQIGGRPSHDDLANAVAGALLLVGARPPMRVSPRVLERSRQPGLRYAY